MPLPFDIPVEPDSDTARGWVQQELAKPDYHSTHNDWLARLMEWLADHLLRPSDIRLGNAHLSTPPWVMITLIIAAVLAVAAFIVFGPMRGSRRRKRSKAIFEDDTRGVDAIRNAAAVAAAAGQWSLATLERFRAIVRAGEEAGVVAVTPGMTAGEFAREGSRRVRALEADLEWAADTFDGLRYADRSASHADYDRMTSLESSLVASKSLGGTP